MIQILATETLAQGIALKTASRRPAIAALALAALAVVVWSRRRPKLATVLLAGAAVSVGALGFWMQSRHAVLLPVPALILVIIAATVAVAERELGLHRGLLQLTRVEKSNSERILERVIADSTDAVVVVDDSLHVLRISRSVRALFDVREDAGPGSRLDEVLPKEMTAAAQEAIAAIRARKSPPAQRRSLCIEKAGETRYIEFTAKPSRLWQFHGRRRRRLTRAIVCLTARDVTAEKQHRARLDRLARFDTLTGALNRPEFVDRLAARLAVGAEGCAVICFNLHRLQTINATLGRAMGDSLLVALVDRLNGAGLGLSPIARLGGDRFAAYTIGATTSAEAGRLTERMSRLLGAPFRLGGQTVRVALRAGVAEGADGDDAELLLGKSELALDEARIRQGPGLRTFDQEAFVRQERTRQIERAHWGALAEEEMYLVYQPQVRLSDGADVGAEALARWKNPTLGSMPPSEFIAIAEGSGFIEHLGRWVLETACLDALEWPEELTVRSTSRPRSSTAATSSPTSSARWRCRAFRRRGSISRSRRRCSSTDRAASATPSPAARAGGVARPR